MKEHWKRRFFTIWAGQAVSVLSSSVLQMALIWHLTSMTKSAAVLSLASIVAFLPAAVIGSFSGVLVDRWNRKVTIICADLFIAAVSLILVFAGWKQEIPVWLILAVLFVRSIGTAFHSPAISAITPLLVPEEALTKCAGYSQSIQVMGFIAGTAVAAIIYPIWSMGQMVMLDVIGAVIASISVALVHIPALPSKEVHEDAPMETKSGAFWREFREGFQVLRSRKGLFALLWIGAVFSFLYSPINALFPLICMDYFQGTTTHASITEVAFSVGMLLGGALLGTGGGFKNRAISVLGAILLMGLTISVVGMLSREGFWVFAVLCVVMGLTAPFFSGPQMALMQEQIQPEYLGRVFGLYGSIMSLAMPLGLAVSGLFADQVGTHRWFLMSGIGCIILAVVGGTIPEIRRIEEE